LAKCCFREHSTVQAKAAFLILLEVKWLKMQVGRIIWQMSGGYKGFLQAVHNRWEVAQKKRLQNQLR